MKFGLEAEKFIFNLRSGSPSKGVFSFLDALTDFRFESTHRLRQSKTTNEFVLNMVEIGTDPSHSPLEVLKDYLFNYLMIQQVALREDVALVPLSALPMDYLPHMTPKWAYFVQNSILAGRKQNGWMMNQNSPLRSAGNCAGMHIHIELSTPPEFLFSNSELKDKFNMGLMITPMIAFASSPYFFGVNEAHSMRGLRYYNGVYKKLPLNGALPPMMESSVQVLNYVKESIDTWIARGVKLGFKRQELLALTSIKGANWNPLRWNRHWNTIEIRCFESDSINLDGAKFIWTCSAFKRMDQEGEALQCAMMKTEKKLDKIMIRDCLQVSGKRVSILPTHAIHELFQRAMKSGTKDKLVEAYLHSLSEFALVGLENEHRWIFRILQRVLDSHQTTSAWMLYKTKGKKKISQSAASDLVLQAIDKQNKIIKTLPKYIPDVFQELDEVSPPRLR